MHSNLDETVREADLYGASTEVQALGPTDGQQETSGPQLSRQKPQTEQKFSSRCIKPVCVSSTAPDEPGMWSGPGSAAVSPIFIFQMRHFGDEIIEN